MRLRADRNRIGVITSVRQHPSGYEYQVFFGSTTARYDESDLEAYQAVRLPRWESRDDLLRDLLLAKLSNPLTDSLYAYRASRTDFEAYQFRPALKFLRNPRQTLLIADEVGLGKTIEAAIIYLELKARLDISRVMVVCPSRLTGKWHDELRTRFEEEFEILNAERARGLIGNFQRLGPSFPIHAIAPLELLRREDLLTALDELNIPLDLLIVDEAHHMRNPTSAAHKLGATLVNTADAVLFLTATPLHLRNLDLYNLLTLLAPDEFDNPNLFEDQVRPNEYVNRASRLVAAGRLDEARGELMKVEETLVRDRFLQNPYYREAIDRLDSVNRTPSLAQRVALQRELAELNTLAGVFTRARKREVAQAAIRSPTALQVRLSPDERAFYDGVLKLARQEARARTGALAFVTIMKERQAASCLIATRELFEDAARGRTARIRIDKSPFELGGDDEDERTSSTQELLELSLRIGETDAKFDRFEETLRRALAEDPTSKALVFSFFKRTLEYLYRRLRSLGYRVERIHGDVPIRDRNRIIEEFRSQPDFRVLLSSEVGAEGLDFQFCDVLVNYDLPWNPMQVEQRIGRLDRFGQTHAKIRIYNLLIEDTVETRIFDRLYERIKIFERSIGDLEAILGDVIVELQQRVLQADLTPEDEARLAEDAATRIERRQQMQDDLEQRANELLGQGHILDQQIENTVKSGRVITAEEVRALVTTFIATAFPRAVLDRDDEEPCYTLELGPELGQHLSAFVARNHLNHRVSDQLRTAMSGHKRLPLTFDSEYARRRPNLEFITVRHPLAEAARAYWESQEHKGIPAGRVQVEGPADEVGDGYFYIHVLDVKAAANQVTLEPVVVLDDGRLAPVSAERILTRLQSAEGSVDTSEPEDAGFAEAEDIASNWIAQRRSEVNEEMRRRNDALIAARSASIRASFDAKIRRTKQLLDEATAPNIRRMRQAQLQNLEVKRDAKLEELEGEREVAVSSDLIAAGRIRVILEAPIPEPIGVVDTPDEADLDEKTAVDWSAIPVLGWDGEETVASQKSAPGSSPTADALAGYGVGDHVQVSLDKGEDKREAKRKVEEALALRDLKPEYLSAAETSSILVFTIVAKQSASALTDAPDEAETAPASKSTPEPAPRGLEGLLRRLFGDGDR